jgi:hypothetical protein
MPLSETVDASNLSPAVKSLEGWATKHARLQTDAFRKTQAEKAEPKPKSKRATKARAG